MLLNRCLTVQVGRPNSHQGKGWEQVTDAAIRALNARTDEQGRPKPLVAILWGRNAQTLEPLLTNAFIIKSPHPSPPVGVTGVLRLPSVLPDQSGVGLHGRETGRLGRFPQPTFPTSRYNS